MKIELESPFKYKWKKAYLRTSKDLRKRVELYNSHSDRSTISYARYLLSVSLGRELLGIEEVDHIDGDRSNDDLSNLQILTKKEHSIKTTMEDRSQDYVLFTCPVCFSLFVMRSGLAASRALNPKCSRSCNGKANNNFLLKTRVLLQEEKAKIENLYLEGKSKYFISKYLKISKRVVINYTKEKFEQN